MLYQRIINFLYSRLFRFLFRFSFKKFGKKSAVIFPLKIEGMKNICLGNNVYIAYKSSLSAMPLTVTESPTLEIGDGTTIGNFNHIFATEKVVIGKKVLTADKVYISDNLHSYEDVTIPIIDQKIKQINHVEIGDGTWIGENVCILGVKIGKNCVIGANSVVTKDIPDYSVVVGSPAVIIKKFNITANRWEKSD
jgi:acetyltransferase-like isoleucine patch superfamily enzyme